MTKKMLTLMAALAVIFALSIDMAEAQSWQGRYRDRHGWNYGSYGYDHSYNYFNQGYAYRDGYGVRPGYHHRATQNNVNAWGAGNLAATVLTTVFQEWRAGKRHNEMLGRLDQIENRPVQVVYDRQEREREYYDRDRYIARERDYRQRDDYQPQQQTGGQVLHQNCFPVPIEIWDGENSVAHLQPGQTVLASPYAYAKVDFNGRYNSHMTANRRQGGWYGTLQYWP